MKQKLFLLLFAFLPCHLLTAEVPAKVLPDSLREKEEWLTAGQMPVPGAAVPQTIRHGYINITELGGGFGLGNTDPDFSKSLISVDNIFGYEINNHFITGIGTGVNFYNGGMLIPLYIDVSYSFSAVEIKPFIQADGGVMISVDEVIQSYLFINPQIGITKKINQSVNLNLSAGVLVQQAPSEGRNSFINFKLGVSFRGK